MVEGDLTGITVVTSNRTMMKKVWMVHHRKKATEVEEAEAVAEEDEEVEEIVASVMISMLLCIHITMRKQDQSKIRMLMKDKDIAVVVDSEVVEAEDEASVEDEEEEVMATMIKTMQAKTKTITGSEKIRKSLQILIFLTTQRR